MDNLPWFPECHWFDMLLASTLVALALCATIWGALRLARAGDWASVAALGVWFGCLSVYPWIILFTGLVPSVESDFKSVLVFLVMKTLLALTFGAIVGLGALIPAFAMGDYVENCASVKLRLTHDESK